MLTWILCSAIALATTADTDAPTNNESNQETYAPETKSGKRPYVFGWMDYSEPSIKLRGGTTTGVPVTLSSTPSAEWTALQATDLTVVERDRQAILAMAGDYRISFDFLEVELYGTKEELTAPYRSWATERVYVLEDSAEQISLQHIIVMFMQMEDGETMGPMLVKHWRQDWTYEPQATLEFIGESQWTNRQLSAEERSGQWQQTVYQVDDSPRYAMRGTWQHNANYSAWNGQNAWRPLPRREHAFGEDYQALVGTNRITINPTGWVHTQDNVKTVLKAPGVVDADNPALAREFGINRYERIIDFDFGAAEEYLENTGDYWSRVRQAWSKHLASAKTVKVDKYCDEERIYNRLFKVAKDINEGEKTSLKKQDKEIEDVLKCSVSTVTPTGQTVQD